MIRFIENIIEPERLLLSWQPPVGAENRLRRFVGELVRQGDDANLRYLRDTEDFQIARTLGFSEYPGFTIDTDHQGVMSAFMLRLPPRKRADFKRYLESFRILPDANISDFALLGYSGAKLPDDDFTIIHPFDEAVPPFELLISVQGYRYNQQAIPYDQLSLGMQAQLVADPENSHDPNAVMVLINENKCGYVCRGLAEQVLKWIRNGYTISASVERLNGYQDNPKIYIFVTVRNAHGFEVPERQMR